MQTVKIYEITCCQAYAIGDEGKSYSLQPWSGDDAYYRGYSDDGTNYIIPDDYYVEEDKLGTPHIYHEGANWPEEIIVIGNNLALCGHEEHRIIKRA